MFGLKHCIYYDCVMNGSNHLEESKRRSRLLCPVCLRKMTDSTGWDVLERENVRMNFIAAVFRMLGCEWFIYIFSLLLNICFGV